MHISVVQSFFLLFGIGVVGQLAIAAENEPTGLIPKHWAFESIQKVEPPPTDNPTMSRAIDRFIGAKWSEKKLNPVSQADTPTLVRRLYYDLIGLPPSADEMKQALTELTPFSDAAWEKLIERMLASPHYGERWGRHWLDVARYADTAGDNADYPVPEARLYRDYVIDSFNSDKPYNQFVKEQLAGDILAAESPRERYAELVTATGFLALSRRYATAPYELWHLTLEDTIDTVGQAFMGLTFKCARCHDHKFDPVTQNEYYSLYGIFDSTQFPWAGGEEFQSMKLPRQNFAPLVPASEAAPQMASYSDMEKQLNERLSAFDKENPLAKSLANLTERLFAYTSASASSAEIADVQTELNKVKKQVETAKNELRSNLEPSRRRGGPESLQIAYAVREGKPHSTVVQESGDPATPGSVVPRGVPTFLPNVQKVTVPDAESGRRQLADWLTSPQHPLTARVMVNRIWQHHFGQGIVSTPSNFGIRGAPPTHPELLDWLARTFIEKGWSVKAMHRIMLTSVTWRLASTHDAEDAVLDPANDYLWRHERTRLDAESIRDSMLSASGQLDRTRPGDHPFPPIVKWNYTQHSQFKDFYPSRHRSVYLMVPRLQRHPFLALFDGPDTNTTTGSRTNSTVSSQALYLMNGTDVQEIAAAFAKRVLESAPEERIVLAYSLAYQRIPETIESEKANAFLTQYTALSDESSAWTALCRSLLVSHEFFHVD